jgi:hypothetical protein
MVMAIAANLITTEEVGRILKLSPARISNFVTKNRLPVAKRIGRVCLFDPDVVRSFKKKPRKNGRPRRAG